MSHYKFCAVLIVLVSDRDLFNLLAAVADPDSGGSDTFGAPNVCRVDDAADQRILADTLLKQTGHDIVAAMLAGTVPAPYRAALDASAGSQAPTDAQILAGFDRAVVVLNTDTEMVLDQAGFAWIAETTA